MKLVNFISNLAMPAIILLIVMYGVKEKNKVFDTFLEGAKEGIETTVNIINPILLIKDFPSELVPLALLRPISGSSSIAVATDIMKNCGVDSLFGIMASTIMGSTETTLYTIAIYTSCIKVKNTRLVLVAALTADIIGMLTSVVVCRILSSS